MALTINIWCVLCYSDYRSVLLNNCSSKNIVNLNWKKKPRWNRSTSAIHMSRCLANPSLVTANNKILISGVSFCIHCKNRISQKRLFITLPQSYSMLCERDSGACLCPLGFFRHLCTCNTRCPKYCNDIFLYKHKWSMLKRCSREIRRVLFMYRNLWRNVVWLQCWNLQGMRCSIFWWEMYIRMSHQL
jgi:hypothetical protein